jgi:hypothetical protein
MTLHTSAQQKAQAELDAVVGIDRLPTPADRVRLPYFEALFCEVLRVYIYGIGAQFLLHTVHIIPQTYLHSTFNISHMCRS